MWWLWWFIQLWMPIFFTFTFKPQFYVYRSRLLCLDSHLLAHTLALTFLRRIFCFNGEQMCKRMKITSPKSRDAVQVLHSLQYKVNFKHFHSGTYTHTLTHLVTHSNKMNHDKRYGNRHQSMVGGGGLNTNKYCKLFNKNLKYIWFFSRVRIEHNN